MAHSSVCTHRYAQKALDGADIVRDARFIANNSVAREEKGGSRTVPPRKVLNLRQEGTVPLRSHFREDTCGACIVDGESHSVLHHRKGPGGGGKTDVGCKIRRIRRIIRSGTEVLNLAGGCPGNVEGRTGELGPWSKEKRVVDCALFGQVEARRPVAHEQRIIRNRDNPEKT